MTPIRDYLDTLDEEVLLLEPEAYDSAIIGLVESASGERVACYDTAKVIKIMMDNDGMDRQGATEYFEVNIAGGYVGPNSPVFLDTVSYLLEGE